VCLRGFPHLEVSALSDELLEIDDVAAVASAHQDLADVPIRGKAFSRA